MIISNQLLGAANRLIEDLQRERNGLVVELAESHRLQQEVLECAVRWEAKVEELTEALRDHNAADERGCDAIRECLPEWQGEIEDAVRAIAEQRDENLARAESAEYFVSLQDGIRAERDEAMARVAQLEETLRRIAHELRRKEGE